MELADRIKELLGCGLPGTVVASSVGVDPSYITQLMEVEEFKNEVLVLRARNAEGAIKRDGIWDDLENKALEKMAQLLPLVTRPADIIRIAQIANTAKRTARELADGAETASPIVHLHVPPGASVHFQMNQQAQVVEIDGRSTAPLPMKKLNEELLARKQVRIGAPEFVEVAVPAPANSERKKVMTILEQIGVSEDAPEVQNVMAANGAPA